MTLGGAGPDGAPARTARGAAVGALLSEALSSVLEGVDTTDRVRGSVARLRDHVLLKCVIEQITKGRSSASLDLKGHRSFTARLLKSTASVGQFSILKSAWASVRRDQSTRSIKSEAGIRVTLVLPMKVDPGTGVTFWEVKAIDLGVLSKGGRCIQNFLGTRIRRGCIGIEHTIVSDVHTGHASAVITAA